MKVLIFGGTAEGRALAEAHLGAGDEVVVCVATEYAKGLLPRGVRCHASAMDEAGMCEAMRREAPGLVLDATHPFAVRATENIRRAAARAGVPLERVARPDSAACGWRSDVEWAADAPAAARALGRTEGNILLTTGSHTLEAYLRALPPGRVYARVLPSAGVLARCEALGLFPSHVTAMQGPFSRALNAALYDQWAIRVLVSKDSGEPGGVTDKVVPALERDIHVIMIERPREG